MLICGMHTMASVQTYWLEKLFSHYILYVFDIAENKHAGMFIAQLLIFGKCT